MTFSFLGEDCKPQMYVRVGIHWWLSVYLLHLFISMYLHVVMEVGSWDSGLGCRSSVVWNMFIGTLRILRILLDSKMI